MNMSSLKHVQCPPSAPVESFMIDYTTFVSDKANTQRRLLVVDAENTTLKAEVAAARKLIQQSTVAISDLRTKLQATESRASKREAELQRALDTIDKLRAEAGQSDEMNTREPASFERADSGVGVSDDELSTKDDLVMRKKARPRLAGRTQTESPMTSGKSKS